MQGGLTALQAPAPVTGPRDSLTAVWLLAIRYPARGASTTLAVPDPDVAPGTGCQPPVTRAAGEDGKRAVPDGLKADDVLAPGVDLLPRLPSVARPPQFRPEDPPVVAVEEADLADPRAVAGQPSRWRGHAVPACARVVGPRQREAAAAGGAARPGEGAERPTG